MTADSDHSSPPPPNHWLWRGFLVLLLGYAAVAIMLPLSSNLVRTRIRAMHLATPSWLAWAPWQLLPSMYNFSNYGEFHMDAEKVSESMQESSRFNHYPAHLLTFYPRNDFFLLNPQGKCYLVLESQYQGHGYRTVHEVHTVGEAASSLTVKLASFEEKADLQVKGQSALAASLPSTQKP